PVNDTWTPISTNGAPAARYWHQAVWTGTHMIVWGGNTGIGQTVVTNTGGLYDPVTDTWTAMSTSGAQSRQEFAAVWTGSQMLVWGHRSGVGIYSPLTNTW